ncbi:MAG: Fic family protein [Cyanobacteria bacterium P01_D01_bin.44]
MQYLESHPWITFNLDLTQADYRFWMSLGEIQSKCKHISGAPLLPEVAEHLYQIFLAKGVLATTAIEGNTLSEEEVLRRINGQRDLPQSKEYLGQEVDNIIKACNEIGHRVLQGECSRYSVQDIQNYNAAVLDQLPLDDEVVPGEIRAYSVGVGRYKGAPAEDCEYLLEKLCSWLNDEFRAPDANFEIAFGVLKAVIIHVYLAWIHPFGDGNGRTARLLEFQTLLSVGVPATAAHLLSNHYNQTRAEYYRQLDATSKSNNGLMSFILYALQGFLDGLAEQITMIRSQQLYVHWINYVHKSFGKKPTATDRRRRDLVLALSSQQEPVPTGDIRYVSPEIAEAYAQKTDRTVKGDLKKLVDMGLILRTPNGNIVNRQLMVAFLPPTRYSD